MKFCACAERCAPSPSLTAPAADPTMAERIPAALQQMLSERLSYYEDIGIRLFYRDRGAASRLQSSASLPVPLQIHPEETHLPKTIPSAAAQRAELVAASLPRKIDVFPAASGPSLFESLDKIADDSLLKIRTDLGDCTRCKLHKGRNTIVFGDGNPKAELVFVGEGPGHDEDVQGLPFVGRAGKLLTQMIEAMGLQRKDVYICNVVKCRPPENRTPEEDEVGTCSPFLLRQIDVIAPKVIVCLGAVAAKTLLQTNRGISQFRGEWLEFRGRKLLATYHPAYLLRNPNAKGEVWKDLQKVMAVLGLQTKKSKSS
jgi:uracil-DNA glycosylase